jgi:hypothetical protein
MTLEKAIRMAIDKTEGDIYLSVVEDIKKLYLFNVEITNLLGI